jgi:hypothetical protein
MTAEPPGLTDFDAATGGQNLLTTVLSSGSGTLTPGQAVNLPDLPVNQDSYELFLTLGMPASATIPFVPVDVGFEDYTLGIGPGGFTYFLGAGQTVSNEYFGCGPILGNVLSLLFFNQDPAQSLSYSYLLMTSPRGFTDHVWENTFFGSVPGFSVPATNPVSDLLASSSVANNPSGGLYKRLLPIWDGPVQFCVPSPPQPGLLTVTNEADSTSMVNRVVAQYVLAAGVPLNAAVSLPKAHCSYTLTNNGASAGTFAALVTGMRQKS